MLKGKLNLEEYEWVAQKQKSSEISYRYGRHENTKDLIFVKRFKKFYGEKIKRRIQKIHELPAHDNLNKHYVLTQPSKDILIFSEYCGKGSLKLDQLITSEMAQQKLHISTIKYIAFQIACALAHLEKHGLNHLRLLPSSVFLFPANESIQCHGKVLVRVTDIGIRHQKWRPNPYIHPDLYDGHVDPYELNYNLNFIYDAWSYGAIVYGLLKGHPPFSKNQFDKEMAVKFISQFYVGAIQSQNSGFLDDIVKRCMVRDGEKFFKSWEEVVKEFIKTQFFSLNEQKPIKDLFEKHVRLIFVFSKIYILIGENLKQPYDKQFWLNQSTMERFKWSLVNLCRLYQDEFKHYFSVHLNMFPNKWKKYYNDLNAMIDNQVNWIKRPAGINLPQNCTIESFLESFNRLAIKVGLKLNDVKKQNLDEDINIVGQFSTEMVSLINKLKNKNNDCHREDLIFLPYFSSKFNLMAEKMGFSFS